KENEEVFARRHTGGKWGERITVTEKPADIFMTAVAANYFAWSEQGPQGWHLKGRTLGGPVETITSGEGNDLFHRMVADRAGNLHVAYQSWRKGASDIYLKSRIGGKWGAEIKLSDAPANDWNPAIAADRNGNVWVAWDSYAGGNYNIFMRPVRGGKPGELL